MIEHSESNTTNEIEMEKEIWDKTDIRILSLKKHHYLDKYKETLQCHYSCWGYYDGLDIIEACDYEHREVRLSRKLSPSPVSRIWYAIEDVYSNVSGRNGIQALGIYRDNDDNCKGFWEQESKNPFLAIAFLQVKDREKKDDLVSEFQKDFIDGEKICKTLTYYTLDNADLILIFSSNSLSELQKKIISVEENSYVEYLHSIQGVCDKYLTECNNQREILSVWNGVKCNVEEIIEQVHFKTVSADVKTILDKFNDLSNKEEWPLNELTEFKDIAGLRIEEHESLFFVLNGITVKKFLQYLVPNGLITHQSPLYESGLFNLHTTVVMHRAVVGTVIKSTRNYVPFHEWCNEIIIDLEQKAKEIFKKHNDGFYAAILALANTLNTLAQYEGFYPARDVYCLLLPSFKVFYEMFCKSWKSLIDTDDDYYQKLFRLKGSTTKFLEHANSVIYHTIHTDQTYLMLPGNCGTPYTLPINLQLMYLWYLRKLTDAFNDQEGVNYQFFIVPVSEIEPRTEKFSFNLNEKDCLINLRLSQRSLSFPRSLLIILGHETMHYVNEQIRKRQVRFEKIAQTISQFTTMLYLENIKKVPLDTDIKESGSKILDIFLGDGTDDNHKESIRYDFELEIYRNLKKRMEDSTEPNRYYAEEMMQLVIDSVTWVVAGAGRQHLIISKKRLDEIEVIISKKQDNYKLLKYLDDIMTKLQENRKHIVLNGLIETNVRKLVKLYKEVFSDLMIINILRCSYTDFEEAFDLSEGCKINGSCEDYERDIRLDIVKQNIFTSPKKSDSSEESKEQSYVEEIYFYEPMITFLEQYFTSCSEDLKTYIAEHDRDLLTEIRKLYSYFNGKNNDYSMKEFSLMLDQCGKEYESFVRRL